MDFFLLHFTNTHPKTRSCTLLMANTNENMRREPILSHKNKTILYSLGFKEKDSAFLEQSVKICIRGQFFVLNKTRRGTRLIF